MVGSFIGVLQTRFSTHAHVAFVDTKKAFGTSWVEATLVLLQGSLGGLLVFFAHFLCHTQSQVQLGALLSEPWDDRDIAQDRVLSPLLLIFSLTHSPMQSTSPLQV